MEESTATCCLGYKTASRQRTSEPSSARLDRVITVRRPMKFHIECETEEDGRWLAEVLEMPGAMAYGSTADEAMARAEAIALRALAEQLEH